MKKEQLTYAEQLPIPSLQNLTGGYRHLTEKTRLGFMFAHEHLVNACDWFVKADDDTYLVLDNLKAFLREQNKSEPVTFGYNLKVMDLNALENESFSSQHFRYLSPKAIILVEPRTFSVVKHCDVFITHNFQARRTV